MTPGPLERFVALSAALTGFPEAELWGTGMVEPYLDELFATVGERSSPGCSPPARACARTA